MKSLVFKGLLSLISFFLFVTGTFILICWLDALFFNPKIKLLLDWPLYFPGAICSVLICFITSFFLLLKTYYFNKVKKIFQVLNLMFILSCIFIIGALLLNVKELFQPIEIGFLILVINLVLIIFILISWKLLKYEF